MNGYERIQAALNGEQPDCTPVMLHNFMLAAREASYTMAEFRNDPRKIADAFIQAVEKYEYDGIMVEIDTATLAGAAGVPVDFPEDMPALAINGCLNSLDEIGGLPAINISDYRYVQNWLEAVRILKDYFKNEIFIRGNCDQAPFSLASMFRTPQEWYMDLMGEEDKVFQLLEYCTDVSIQFIDLMSETGAHMLSNGDSPAGSDLISPDMYTKFAMPFERQLVERTHQHGLSYALHICGFTDIILDPMIETGANALELDYKTDAHKANEILQDRATFIGNLDPSSVLALGTVQDVQRETEEILNVFADNPRFILNAGCAIPPSTPSENIKEMIRIAHS